jgi:hypothetical protein
MYVSMYPIANGFRDRDISLYSSKSVDKTEILRTVSNTDIYCSSDKVSTFSKSPPPTSAHFATRVRTWRVARLYSVLHSEIALSRKPFGIGNVHIHFLPQITDTMTSLNIDLSPGTLCVYKRIRPPHSSGG